MAIVAAATNAGITRSGTFLNLVADWTIAGWLEPVTSTPSGGQSRTFFLHGDPAYTNPYLWIGSSPDTADVFLQVWDGGSAVNSTTTATALDVWENWALVYTASGTSLDFYLNNVLVDTLTVDLSTYTFVEKLEYLLTDTLGPWSDSAAANIRVWSVALTSAQLFAEWGSATPVVTTGLLANTPLATSTSLGDTTGNGHSWTALGVITTTDGPMVSGTFHQVIFSRTYGNDGVAPQGDPMWSPIRANGKFHSAFIDATAEARCTHPWSVAGTFSNFWGAIYIPELRRATTSPMSWDALTMTVKKNGTPTSFVLSFPAGLAGSAGVATSNTTDTLDVVPGDVLTIERSSKPVPMLNGVGAHFLWSMSFTPTANDQSGYASGGDGILNGSGTGQVCAPWNGGFQFETANWNSGATGDNEGEPSQWSIVPVHGSVVRLDVNLTVAPGMGKSRTFKLQVNGADATDSTVTIADLATGGFAICSVPVAPLDYLTLRHDNAGTPAASQAMFSTAFTPTTPGQYAYCVNQGNSNASTAATDWFGGLGGGNEQGTPYAPTPPGAPPADGEQFMSLPGGIDPFTLTGFIVAIYQASGTAKSYTATMRKNLASPVGGPTVTLPDTTSVVQDNAGLFTVSSPTDLIDLQTDPTGSPNTVHWGWTFLVVSPTTPVPPIIPDTRVIRRERKWLLPSSENNYRMTMHKLEFVLQAGIGLPEGSVDDPVVLGSDPQVMLRISYDGGNTWGQERWASAGKIGQYDRRVVFWQCGQYRNAVADLVVTDPVPWTFIKCIGEWTEGTS